VELVRLAHFLNSRYDLNLELQQPTPRVHLNHAK
jgi:hypothetical protein